MLFDYVDKKFKDGSWMFRVKWLYVMPKKALSQFMKLCYLHHWPWVGKIELVNFARQSQLWVREDILDDFSVLAAWIAMKHGVDQPVGEQMSLGL